MTLCKTCGRRPSERTSAISTYDDDGIPVAEEVSCGDPIHLAADAASELVEALEELRAVFKVNGEWLEIYLRAADESVCVLRASYNDPGVEAWRTLLAQADAALLLARGKG